MERIILIEKVTYSFDEEYHSLTTKNKYNEGHSFYGMPALELREESTLFWLKNGRVHNDIEQVATIKSINSILFNGIYQHLAWSVNGNYHRDSDKPSIITTEGTMLWFKRGKIHRDFDKPAVICNAQKIKAWYKNDYLYKRDGNKPNLIIGDSLFWIEMNEDKNEFVIKKHKHKNKIDNLLQNKGVIITFSISIVIYLIIFFLNIIS